MYAGKGMRMPLMERYIFRRVASAFFLALIVLVGTLWMTQVLKQLDVVTAKGQTVWIFLFVTFLAMPELIQIIAPVAFLIAVVFVLNSLNAEGELAAMTASGAARNTVGRPVFIIAILLSVALWFLYNFVSPYSLSGLRYLITQIRAEVIAALVKDGGFRSVENGLTMHIRKKSADGRFLGIFVSDDRDPEESIQYLAKSGVLLKNDQGTFLVMEDGDLVRQLADDSSKNVVAFENYAFDLSQFTNTGKQRVTKARERTTTDLMTLGEDDAYRKKFPALFWLEFHRRTTAPLYPIAFAPIILSFLGRPRTNRQDRGYASAAASLICTLLFGAGFAAAALVESSGIFFYFMYLIPLAGFAFGSTIMGMNIRLRIPKFAERAVDGVASVMHSIGNRFRSANPAKGSTA